MKMIAAQDVAIARAIKAGTLVIAERVSRFGDLVYFISDEVGIIECCLSREEADGRVADIKRAL